MLLTLLYTINIPLYTSVGNIISIYLYYGINFNIDNECLYF